MRRRIAAGALVALLAGSCGESDLSASVADRLQARVAAVRRAAEARAPREALERLQTLSRHVRTLLIQGEISEDRAVEIADAMELVETGLVLLPARSPSPSATTPPPPSPVEEDGGDEGDGGGNGEGNGDKGKGNDKGHGNDD